MWNFLLWATLGIALPQTSFPLGSIVESVACRDRAEQKYALFLPANYNPAQLWPVVIMLDPAARGTAPLERFADAADELGFILVGSHNSKNGPLEPSVEALTAIWSDVSRRFSIDPARIYLAGFSGGARMASHFARNAKVAGVVACGAGLLSGDAERFPFVYAASAGRQDMNYLEVRVLVENLIARGTRATFLEFDGDHDWPPKEIARRALQWLRVEAMRRKLEPEVPEFLTSYRDASMERAKTLQAKGRGYEALLAYQALIRDLEGLSDVAQARVQVDLLTNDPRVHEQRRRQAKTDEVERREVEALFDQFLSDHPSKSESWWKRKLRSYEELAGRNLRNAEDLSKRLKHFVLSYGMEKSWFAAQEREYRRALYFIRVALLARPDSPELHYRLARLLALTGEAESALSQLQKAVELGWEDRSRFNQDEAFQKLRERPDFKRLIPPE